jgi:GTPase SAR1 family protein
VLGSSSVGKTTMLQSLCGFLVSLFHIYPRSKTLLRTLLLSIRVLYSTSKTLAVTKSGTDFDLYLTKVHQ